MKTAARNVFHIMLLMLAALYSSAQLVHAQTLPANQGVQAGQAQGGRDLMALGSDQVFWLADVAPSGTRAQPSTKTTIRYRVPGESQWRLAGEFSAAAKSLATRGSELLVVLDNGDWKIVSGTDVRSGIPLPGGARVLALAGDGDNVWAIGAAGSGKLIGQATTVASAAVTQSSTAGSTAKSLATSSTTTTSRLATSPSATSPSSTLPSTAPALPPHELGLFLLERGDWIEKAVLPASILHKDIDGISLAMLDGRLMLAIGTIGRPVEVFTYDNGSWSQPVDFTTFGEGWRVKLLDFRGKPAMWVGAPASPGSLYVQDGEKWGMAVKLQPPGKLGAFDRMTLAPALGQMRLIASDGKGRLAEQVYNPDGTTSGELTEAITTSEKVDTRIIQMVQLILVGVMFVWMMGTMKQRPNLQEAVKRVEQLNLAPLGRRFLGGLIDALPIFIAAFLAERAAHGGWYGASHALGAKLTYESPEMAWMAAGFGLYFLHTTVFELIFARSIGKFIVGTRVATLEGTRPTAVAILTRNLLRLVDVILLFPPVFVFFSPLRQRVGDMAAGTIVVRNEAKPADPVEPPPTA